MLPKISQFFGKKSTSQPFSQWNADYNNSGQTAKGPSMLDTWTPGTSKPLAAAPKTMSITEGISADAKMKKDNATWGAGRGAGQRDSWTNTDSGYDLMH